jgi:hypothetical protein
MEVEMKPLRSKRTPKYLPRYREFKIDSLKQKAFEALPRNEQLMYLSAVKEGQVHNVKAFPFMTEKEYHANRLQYERDKHPEIYKDVPRVGNGLTNPWVKHVKEYQSKHGCSYKEAMQLSKKSYKL